MYKGVTAATIIFCKEEINRNNSLFSDNSFKLMKQKQGEAAYWKHTFLNL
jgi:hypothetical protein